MVLGDMQAWTARFVSLDERMLQRIVAVWPNCRAVLGPQPTEDTITINLVDGLGKDEIARRLCHWVEYQFEPFGTDASGAKFSKGKIDIAVLLDQDRSRYLAYECKRLNVTNSGRRSSLATEYVSNGMMRFMTEQYAEQLPVGGMLGYVMDGDAPFARKQVGAAIAGEALLVLVDGPNELPPQTGLVRFITRHTRATAQQIELRHALLNFA